MKYLHYVLSSLARKFKKSKARTPYLDYFDSFIEIDEPTIVLTHDIDEGYEPNIDNIVDLEKKYGVNSTMFLLAMSHPTRKWIQLHQKWDFQFHANFIGRDTANVFKQKEQIDNLIGKKTDIVRAHQYELPDIRKLGDNFRADSSYDNWTRLSFLKPFKTDFGMIEFPHLPEIEFIDLFKHEGNNIFKIYDEIISTAKKTNGMIVLLTHPTPFKQWGCKIQEHFLTKDGFKFMTMTEVLNKIEKIS